MLPSKTTSLKIAYEQGQVGTIVEILALEIYEVEFSDDNGQTYATRVLSIYQILKLYLFPFYFFLELMNDAELLAIIAQAEREGWTELDLSGNDLEGLPSEIGRLQSLERLILGKWDYEIINVQS
ncbi:DUF4926 domain-containing protein [Pseudanabaena biceps]|nr:DUF4926 domain-containing protein [Pseudanabaena biceps]